MGVALVVALAAVGLLGFSSTLNPIDALLGRGAIVTVPDVIDDARPRAVAEIESQGLVAVVESAFSLTAPRGTIIGQTPRGGAKVREGTEVEVVVSKGANRVEMPDAVGRPLREVAPPFDSAGIPLVIDRVPSETVEGGIVIAQDPGPGIQVTGEDTVSFTVSSGSADRPVPEVMGKSPDAASFELGRAGLAVGEVELLDDEAVPAGAVVSSNPPTGEVVGRDTVVDLVVSAGPTPLALPNVTNRTEASATEALRDLGFVVAVAGQLVGPSGDGTGAVFAQYPAAGATYRPGATVTIVVGRRAPAASTPEGDDHHGAADHHDDDHHDDDDGAGSAVSDVTTTTDPTPSPTAADPGERITEIGRPEEVDRSAHPIATAVGILALLAVVVLGLVGLAASSGDEDAVGEVAEVVIPRLGGRPLAEGQAELERLGLIVDVRYEPNEIVPVDVIVDQTPIAGARLEVGQQVILAVSDGPVGITVPELLEVSAPEAVRLLAVLGLTGVPEPVFDEVVAQNAIVATVPAAGGRADIGSEVRILVSQGPRPRTVPEIVGTASTEAFAAIGRAELQVGKVSRRTTSDQPAGTVLSVDPGAGSQVARDLPLDVVIAAAPTPAEVPDLVGLTQGSAESVADDRGFRVSVQTEDVAAGDRRSGRVIRQRPIANSPLEGGGRITIVVGVAPPPPAPTTVPPTTTAPP